MRRNAKVRLAVFLWLQTTACGPQPTEPTPTPLPDSATPAPTSTATPDVPGDTPLGPDATPPPETPPGPTPGPPSPLEPTPSPVPTPTTPPTPWPTPPTTAAETPTPEEAFTPTPGAGTPLPFDVTPTPASTPVSPPFLRVDSSNPIPLVKRFEVDLESPGAVRLVCEEQGGEGERHVVRAAGADRYFLSVRGLKPATRYECRAEREDRTGLSSEPVEVGTDPLPGDLEAPVLMVQDAPRDRIGYALFNYSHDTGGWVYESRYLVIVDADGHVRWYLPGVGGGTIDATYIGEDRVLYGGYAFGETHPTISTLDWVVLFEDTSGPPEPHGMIGSYHHDVGLAVEGDAIFALMKIMIDDTQQGYTVRHVDLGSNLLWEWDSAVDGRDAGYLPVGDDSTNDPYHANSAQDVWEQGRRYIYVGMRTTSSIIKIDYETKAVLWTLGVDGDFVLLEPDGTPAEDYRWFFMQHDAKRYGDRMVIYDNGLLRRDYGGPYNYSRALELELDEQAMTARITFEYDEAAEGWIEEAWGGCDLLANGNYFIAMGHCWDCNPNNTHLSALVEVDPNGRQISRLEWTNPEVALYRADRIDGCAIFANTTYCPELE